MSIVFNAKKSLMGLARLSRTAGGVFGAQCRRIGADACLFGRTRVPNRVGHGYPTEWVIRTRVGQSVATIEDWDLLVTTYVGQSLRSWAPESGTFGTDAVMLTPAIWSKLGAALAQLHNVPIDSASSLPKAGMLPTRELTWVGQYIGEVADQVPSHW